jgi:DNA-binding SARP family transcriptional activator
VEEALPGRQGRLLFAFLLLERDRGASRDQLAALLWPENPPPTATATLRALLSKLRAGLGADAVRGTSELRIDLGKDAWIDVEAGFSAMERAGRAISGRAWRQAWSAAQVALSIASQHFLPGEDGEWIEDKRRELEDMRLVALERLARVALELGGSELVSAERCARALLEAAPYRESGYLLLMRALAARGNPAEAVRVYDRARALLRDELGIPPAPELRALNEQLVGAESKETLRRQAVRERVPLALPPLLAGSERTPLIGRTEALGSLIRRFDAALASGPCAAALTGEAGIGKTRLIGELARAIQDRDGAVLYGAAPRQPSPFQPYLDALRQFIGGVPAAGLARLRAIDPPVIARLLPELHEDLGLPPEPTADEEAGRARALAALTRTFEEIAGQGPVVLALDDMHWGDPASLQLLAHLLRTAHPVPLLVLVAYRSGEGPPALADALEQARRRAPIQRVELSPLTEQDVEALISAWAGTGAPTSFARDLHERADGNPFFIGQLLRHLVRAGAIDPDLRRWATAHDIFSLGVPHEVRELIELRLSRFDRRGREALNAAAVIGQEFTLAIVERVIGDTGNDALDALDAAIRAGLVVENGDPGGTLRFTHALIREAIYAQLSGARRGRLHRAVGAAIQSLHAADLAPHQEELARHFVAAARAGEDPMPAIGATLAAAEYGRRLFANEQAEAHYHTALELLEQRPDPNLRAQGREGLGDMLTIGARYAEAVEAYLEALANLPTRRPVERARIERKLGVAHMRARRDHAALEAFDRAEQALRPTGDSQDAVAETINIALDRLTLLYWQDNTAAMGAVIEQVSPSVDRHSTPIQRVRLINSTLVWEMRRRRFRLTQKSVDLARQALAATEATGDTIALAFARFLVGFALLWSDAPDQAVDHLEQAIDLSTRAGQVMYEARSLAYLSVAHRLRLSTGPTERNARKALDAATSAKTPEYQAIARANLAWVAARMGAAAAARDHAQFALNRFAEIPFQIPFFVPLALWPLIAVALTENNLAAATAYAERLLIPQHRPVSRPVATLLRAAIDCQAREPDQATRRLARALQLADGITLTTSVTTLAGR